MSEPFARKLEELPDFAARSNDHPFGLFVFAILMLAAGALVWLFVAKVLSPGWTRASAVVDGYRLLLDWQGAPEIEAIPDQAGVADVSLPASPNPPA